MRPSNVKTHTKNTYLHNTHAHAHTYTHTHTHTSSSSFTRIDQ